MIFQWTFALSDKGVSHVIYKRTLHPVWCTTSTTMVIRLIPLYETIKSHYFVRICTITKQLFFFPYKLVQHLTAQRIVCYLECFWWQQ